MSSSRHLFLTGYRGTGKSTVAVILGRKLGRPVIDLDHVIEQRAEKSIRDIFRIGGEPMFRDLETEALSEAVGRQSSVISLGGGAILRATNRELLRRSGTCFWLDADAETIVARLQGDATTADRRPALTNLGELEEIRQLLQQRRPLYQAAADHKIETSGREASEVADEIVDLWPASP